jgi:hypothetical protein
VSFSGTVDESDYAVLDGNYGSGVGSPLSPARMNVPEPAATIMLAAGSALLFARTRRRK